MVSEIIIAGIKKNIEKVIEKALLKASFDIEAHAVRIVPVDTGRLRASIRTEVSGNTITLSAGTDYAEYVEFGTFKMNPQPFMRPAVRLGLTKFIPNRITEELKNVMPTVQ